MLSKKFYIGIGVLAICAISFLLLRSDVPKEPINIYKAVKPLPKSTEQLKAEVPVAKSQGGHFHSDGTWHEGPHEAEVKAPAEGNLQQTQTATRQTSSVAQGKPIKAGDSEANANPLLEDRALAELDVERRQLLKRQSELNEMLFDHISAVVGKRITPDQVSHGILIGGDELPHSQVERELEELRLASENLQKAQVEWRWRYIQHTGEEYPGTEHWIPHVARDREEVQKQLQYEMGSRGWILVDP